MESLFILIPLSLVIVVLAVLFFFRMNKQGQFDDDIGPAMSILLDNDRPEVHDQSNNDHADVPADNPLGNTSKNSLHEAPNNGADTP